MITVNLDTNLIDWKGNPLDEKASEVLANLLATASTNNPARMMAWAIALVNDGEMTATKDELRDIINLIKNNQNIVNFAKAILIDLIEKAVAGGELDAV